MTDKPSDRLRSARAAAGFSSAAEAARSRGWKEASYRHHENGTRGFGKDHARAYARAFGVSPGWLLCLEDKAEPSVSEKVEALLDDYQPAAKDAPEVEEFLMANSRQSLVHHFEMADFRDLYPALPSVDRNRRMWIKAFDEAIIETCANVETSLVFSVYADDDSMSPTVGRGSPVLIDAGQRELDRQEGIWLIAYGGHAMLRRIRSLPGGMLELYGDNDIIRPHVVEATDVNIRGSAIWTGRFL